METKSLILVTNISGFINDRHTVKKIEQLKMQKNKITIKTTLRQPNCNRISESQRDRKRERTKDNNKFSDTVTEVINIFDLNTC